MREEARRICFQELQEELQFAELHAAQGKDIVERQRKCTERLRAVSGPDTRPTQDADTLLRVFEDTQRLFHVNLLRREITTET